MELSEKLREAREVKGWSMAKTARNAGISKGYLHALESGDSLSPGIKIVQQLEQALDTRLLDSVDLTDMTVQERQLLEAWRNGRVDVLLLLIANKVTQMG